MSSPQDRYAQDQARLQAEGGVGDEDDDLHLEIPAAPEVNPEVYRDVEPILFKGFVYQAATINGVGFVFKSLNHHELEQLNLFDTDKTKLGQKRAYSLYLAYSVLFIDCTNVLADRERWIPQLATTFEEFGDGARGLVVSRLSELNRRATRAVLLTEAYATEHISRLRWAQMNGMDITSPAVTGVAGTQQLGMNWGQLTWRAINRFEDHKETAEREWENTKFSASAMAGKGMSKVYSQDRQRRKNEAQERAARKDKILRFALLGEPLGEASKGGAVVNVARTLGELTQQLERDLKGEKDFHDMVVDEYERRAREQYAERQSRIRELQAEADARYGERPVVGATEMKGLTPEEVRFRMDRRRQLTAQKLAQQQQYPELHDPKVARFVNRWVQPDAAQKVRSLPIPPPKKDDR